MDLLAEIPTALKTVVDEYIQSNGRIPLEVVGALQPGDVVYLATPPDFHLLQLFEILCSGCGALVAVEKPLCWLQHHVLAERACDVLAKYSQSVVYVEHYTWIDHFDHILLRNAAPPHRVKQIEMALIDDPDGVPSHRLYALQDGVIGDCVCHLYALLMKWLRHQQIGEYRLQVQEVIAASYLQGGKPLPIKGEMAVSIQSKLFANGDAIDLIFRAAKGTGHVEKIAKFISDGGAILAECNLDSHQAYSRILTTLLEQRTDDFLRLPEALHVLRWMVEVKTQAIWQTPFTVGQMPLFLSPPMVHHEKTTSPLLKGDPR